MKECDRGLYCVVRCSRIIPYGEPCDVLSLDVCQGGSSCEGPLGARRCVRYGVPGGRCVQGVSDPACEEGLTCSDRYRSGICGYATLTAGMPCGVPGSTSLCAPGLSCQGNFGAQRCYPDGMLGGYCERGGMTNPCADGLVCARISVSSRCVQELAEGMPCAPDDPTMLCAEGTSCAVSGALGACRRDGTAAGSWCRRTAPRCDPGLTCNSDREYSGVCQTSGTLGGACSSLFASVACPSGSGCLATGPATATCTAARPETEPNDTPTAPQGVTSPTVFSGTVNSPGDRADCFRVDLPANGVAVFEVSVPGSPFCLTGPETALYYGGASTLLNPGGHGRSSCGTYIVRAPVAGGYILCLGGRESHPVRSYLVSIGFLSR